MKKTITTILLCILAFVSVEAQNVLFVRGGNGSGGFLEGGSNEQLADIGNFQTFNGNHGWGTFAQTLRNNGYTLTQIEEGNGGNSPVNFASLNLAQYDIIVLGSNNAFYNNSQVNAIENWVRNGGGLLTISDANFGGSWCDAPNSDQRFLSRFGIIVHQDNGTYSLNRNSGDFVVGNHPILQGVNRFDGEGVSPLRRANNVPNGVNVQRIVKAKSTIRLNNGNGGNCQGSTRGANNGDAALMTATAGSGRVVAHYDRNTFFNQNGAGTNINRFDNKRYMLNIFDWLTNGSTPPSPTCNDGIQNQGETGVDCGGPCSPCNTSAESVTLTNIPNQSVSNQYTFSVNYSANQQRDVQVEIRAPNNNWLGLGKVTVNSGSGVVNVTVNLNTAAAAGNGYKATTLLVPVGANWQQQIDNDSKFFNIGGGNPPPPPPSGGDLFYVVNRQTGKKLRPQNNTNGAAMIQANASQTGNITKWEQVNTSNGYFYLKNVESGMYFRPSTNNDGSALVQRPTNYSGNYTQWRKVTSSNGYFYLQNRATGKYFRPQWDGDNSPIEQRPTTWSGNYTQWKFENAGTRESGTTTDFTVEAYKNPTQLKISTPDPGKVTVTAFDLSGQAVSSKTIEVYADTTEIYLPEIGKGLHIVQVIYNGNKKTVKVVNK